MIIKKTGLVIAAAAATMILSGCATGARNVPESSICCEPPCCAPSNCCKCMSDCKQVCPVKQHRGHRHHHHHRAENAQTQMNA